MLKLYLESLYIKIGVAMDVSARNVEQPKELQGQDVNDNHQAQQQPKVENPQDVKIGNITAPVIGNLKEMSKLKQLALRLPIVRTIVQPKTLIARNEAKHAERKAVFVGYTQAMSHIKDMVNIDTSNKNALRACITKDLNDPQVRTDKITQQITQRFKAAGQPVPADAELKTMAAKIERKLISTDQNKDSGLPRITPHALKDIIKNPAVDTKALSSSLSKEFVTLSLPGSVLSEFQKSSLLLLVTDKKGSVNHAALQLISNKLEKKGSISANELVEILPKPTLYERELPDLAKNLTDMHKDRNSTIESASKELSNHILKLDKLINSDPSFFDKAKATFQGKNSTSGRNNEIMKEVRAALNSPAYQALKECESNPCVRVLHDLCVAGYLNAPVMGAMEKLGGDVFKPLDESVSVKDLPEIKHQDRQKLLKGGIFQTDMNNPIYMLSNPQSTAQALASQLPKVPSKILKGIPKFLNPTRIAARTAVKFDKYDPRVTADNQAGGGFKTKVKVGSKESTMTNFFTPSWRLDTDVPPEAKAMLQSLTNRQAKPVDADNHVAKQVCYNNAQERSNPYEGKSSEEIMKLNNEYPDAFIGTTMPCDSDFHTRGLGHGGHTFDNLYPEGTQQPEDMRNFSNSLKNKMLSPESFTLDHPKEKSASGYYFHCRTDAEREACKADLGKICDHLETKYEKIQNDNPALVAIRDKIDAKEELTADDKVVWWHFESAMIEESNMMVGAYQQAKGLQRMLDAGVKDPGQAETWVCKELADRGKARMVVKLMCSMRSENGKIDATDANLLRAMAEFRPIAARNRIGLAHRDATMNGLMMHRDPNELRDSMDFAMNIVLGGQAARQVGFELVR